MKAVGEPDAGNPQVRFDEGGLRNGRALLYQGGTALLHPVMAVKASAQDKRGPDKNIILVSPVSFNRNVTMSGFR